MTRLAPEGGHGDEQGGVGQQELEQRPPALGHDDLPGTPARSAAPNPAAATQAKPRPHRR